MERQRSSCPTPHPHPHLHVRFTILAAASIPHMWLRVLAVPVNAAAVSGVLPTAGCPYGLTPALGSARGVSTCTLARRGRALEDHTSPPAPAPPPVPPPPYATGEVITVEPMVEAWAVDAASSQEGARGVLGGGPTGESRVEGRVWDAGGVSVTMG